MAARIRTSVNAFGFGLLLALAVGGLGAAGAAVVFRVPLSGPQGDGSTGDPGAVPDPGPARPVFDPAAGTVTLDAHALSTARLTATVPGGGVVAFALVSSDTTGAEGPIPAPGLALVADGSLSGRPTRPGSFGFTVRATSAGGPTDLAVTLTVRAPETCDGVAAVWTAAPDGAYLIDPGRTGQGFTVGCDFGAPQVRTLVAVQVPAAPYTEVTDAAIAPQNAGRTDATWRLATAQVARLGPRVAWYLEEQTPTSLSGVYFDPSCRIDWRRGYDSAARVNRLPTACQRAYTGPDLATPVSDWIIYNSALGIGQNNAARFCSARMADQTASRGYPCDFAQIPTTTLRLWALGSDPSGPAPADADPTITTASLGPFVVGQPVPAGTRITASDPEGGLLGYGATAGSDPMGPPLNPGAWAPAPGVSIDGDGRVTGTPTQTGTFPATLFVIDAAGNTATRAITTSVQPASLSWPAGAGTLAADAYLPVDLQLAASGTAGTPSYTITASDTGSPGAFRPAPGLTLSSGGRITGTGPEAGSFAFTVRATAGGVNSDQQIVLTLRPTETCEAVRARWAGAPTGAYRIDPGQANDPFRVWCDFGATPTRTLAGVQMASARFPGLTGAAINPANFGNPDATWRLSTAQIQRLAPTTAWAIEVRTAATDTVTETRYFGPSCRIDWQRTLNTVTRISRLPSVCQRAFTTQALTTPSSNWIAYNYSAGIGQNNAGVDCSIRFAHGEDGQAYPCNYLAGNANVNIRLWLVGSQRAAAPPPNAAPTIVTAGLGPFRRGQTVSAQMAATDPEGDLLIYGFAAGFALGPSAFRPAPGLTADGSGLVTGTATTAGTYTSTISVTDAAGNETTRQITTTVLARSCLELLTDQPGLLNGIYTLDFDGAGPLNPVDTYCVMATESDGAGWTLLGVQVPGALYTGFTDDVINPANYGSLTQSWRASTAQVQAIPRTQFRISTVNHATGGLTDRRWFRGTCVIDWTTQVPQNTTDPCVIAYTDAAMSVPSARTAANCSHGIGQNNGGGICSVRMGSCSFNAGSAIVPNGGAVPCNAAEVTTHRVQLWAR